MRECAATFKVGIWFENWARIGDQYIHPFGRFGLQANLAEYHNFWLHSVTRGSQVPLGEYCFEWLAAMKGKFAMREKPRINYAYHFDAALYARYLRKLCEPKGVKRIEGKIKEVRTHADGSCRVTRAAQRPASSRATSSSTARVFAACSSRAR